ncbi:UNVERIFIED_CONTAM: hypothetical protein Slati_3905400 [Sesamum latifolium]|uniref:Uncharacterized protein n=1 Tax=Sesamum latifolium TaxID=2727402 RepID=A0AAW2TNC8_9LAMI
MNNVFIPGCVCTLDACLITVVYGSNNVANRRGLWGNLVSIMETVDDVPWMVMGDFNTVLDYSEVCGASGDIGTAMEEFRSCVVDMGLLPIPLQGAVFTWHNCSIGPRSLWKRLDRMLVNDSWFARWPESVCLSSTPRTSDHSPLILRGHAMHRSGRLFCFDNFLAAVPGFMDVVNNVWRHTIVGTPMYAVTRKLKLLKPIFRAMRRKKGDVSENVTKAKEFLRLA